jgi:uncharacterized damage-inducible protein DinB
MYGKVSFFMLTLAQTFLLNNRVNLMLLDAMTDAQLAHVPFPRARSIADQFAHLHTVRIMWLEVAAKDRAQGLKKIEKGAATKAELRRALEASAEALAAVIDESVEAGKMRGYKRGPITFCSYLLAHEGHHRGEIIVHLKHAKMPVDRDLTYALWEWEKL